MNFGMQQRRWTLSNTTMIIGGIILGFTISWLAYNVYWYIGLVMEENELDKDNKSNER